MNAAWQQWNIAVTGVNARAESPGPGCAVARCLREHKDFHGQVIGLGYDVFDAGLYARDLCHGGYLVPYPSAGQETLLQRIAEIHARERLDAIIPCLDSELQNFISLRRQLAQMGIKMLIPSRDQFLMRSKVQLSTFCQSIGVAVPRTKVITNPAFFDTCQSEGWHYPLVVKGVFYDAGIAYTPADARAIFARLVHAWGYPVVVQSLIEGDEFDLAGLGDGKGNLLGAVMMRKRGLTDKGKAWAGVTVIDEAIGAVATKLVRALSWRGPLEVEVMKDRQGRVHLIEINPRFPAWIYLSHAVGRNLPVALVQLMSQDKNIQLDEPRSGTFFIRYAQEVIVQLGEFEAMLVDGSLAAAPEEQPLTA